MEVSTPMYISSKLMAAYDFEDGSTLHVSPNGEYLLEDAQGKVIVEGDDLRPAPSTQDTLELAASMASFIGHDGELYEFSPDGSWGSRYPDSASEVDLEDWIFGPELGKWADEHYDELSELATLDEEE